MTGTVVCVLKSGGEYRPKHAGRLYDQFLHHAPVNCEFVCLTDLPRELETANVPAVPLTAGWPGWWSKIEAFALPGPCLYLDLDVTIVGDLEPLLDVSRETEFTMCRSFWVQDPGAVNSSVMAWQGDMAWLYRRFAEKPEEYMRLYKTRERWGDQVWIYDNLGRDPEVWQDLVPGAVVSFKRGALKGESLERMIVCVSHGQPKPWGAGGADQWLGKLRDHPR